MFNRPAGLMKLAVQNLAELDRIGLGCERRTDRTIVTHMDRDSLVWYHDIGLQLESLCSHRFRFVDVKRTHVTGISSGPVGHLNLEEPIAVDRHVSQVVGRLERTENKLFLSTRGSHADTHLDTTGRLNRLRRRYAGRSLKLVDQGLEVDPRLRTQPY